MSEINRKNDSIEVTSDPLKAELVAIKDRLSAIETIQSIANRPIVEKYVREHLKTEKGKQVMRECEQPRTRDYLVRSLKLGSRQSLDHHLNVLLEDDLIRRDTGDDGVQTFEWSNLFKRLPKKVLQEIISDSRPAQPASGSPTNVEQG